MTTETTEISTQTQKQERMMPLLPTYGASGIPQEWQHPSYGFADSVSSMSPRDARQALGDRLTSYGITNALHIAEGIIRDEGATGFAYAEASERLKQAQTPERAVSPAEAILEEEREK